MELLPDFRDLLVEFERSAVEAVLVGGYAVAFHGHPRSTKDIDLVLAPDAANLARAADALARFGAPRAVADAVRTMADSDVVWFGQEPGRVDLLRAIDGVTTADLFAHARSELIDGVRVRVISPEDLITNKRAAGRLQDLADAEKLERLRARAGGVE